MITSSRVYSHPFLRGRHRPTGVLYTVQYIVSVPTFDLLVLAPKARKMAAPLTAKGPLNSSSADGRRATKWGPRWRLKVLWMAAALTAEGPLNGAASLTAGVSDFFKVQWFSQMSPVSGIGVRSPVLSPLLAAVCLTFANPAAWLLFCDTSS